MISSRLVTCSLSHPFLSQSRKLTFASYQKRLRSGKDSLEEVVVRAHLLEELTFRLSRQVALLAPLCSARQRRGEYPQPKLGRIRAH